MQALDIEEVRLAGRPKPPPPKKQSKIVRYPTQFPTLNEAVRMCAAGDCIAISPGVYTESVEIDRDLTMYRDGPMGEVVIVARHGTAVEVNRCSAEIRDITFAVEEGALMHHAFQADHANLELDSVEFYGGLYGFFAFDNSNVTANRCRFHNAYSHGCYLLNSAGRFENCFFFRNKECGVNLSGHPSDVSFFRCRVTDNGCHGLHAHTGAAAKLDACDVLRNEWAGLAVTGVDERRNKNSGTGGKVSEAWVRKCKVAANNWQGVLVLDGSAHVEESDLRRNIRGALTLSCSRSSVNKILEANQQQLDPEYYSAFQETGTISLKGNLGLLDDGQTQICYGSELPADYQHLDAETIFDLFKNTDPEVQRRLPGYPQGYTSDIRRDPQARIKVVALFRKWAMVEKPNTDQNEMEIEVHEFLQPLGLEIFTERFQGCACFKLHDIISFTDEDLLNIGMKNVDDRRMVLSRLAASSGSLVNPKHMKPLNFNSLIEATLFQARADDKNKFNEWKKAYKHFSEVIGNVTSGPPFEKAVRALFNELDADGNAAVDLGELTIGIQKLGVNMAQVDVEQMFKEADQDQSGDIDYQEFTQVIQTLMRS